MRTKDFLAGKNPSAAVVSKTGENFLVKGWQVLAPADFIELAKFNLRHFAQGIAFLQER